MADVFKLLWTPTSYIVFVLVHLYLRLLENVLTCVFRRHWECTLPNGRIRECPKRDVTCMTFVTCLLNIFVDLLLLSLSWGLSWSLLLWARFVCCLRTLFSYYCLKVTLWYMWNSIYMDSHDSLNLLFEIPFGVRVSFFWRLCLYYVMNPHFRAFDCAINVIR